MLPTAQDHKRIGEGDVGLNTGGMGVYAPAPVATQPILDQIMNTILKPTIDGMRKEGSSIRSTWDAPAPSSSSSALAHRLSLRRHALYRVDIDRRGSQSPRIQRSVRRSRSGGTHAFASRKRRPCCCLSCMCLVKHLSLRCAHRPH
jgi:hypothetical protein